MTISERIFFMLEKTKRSQKDLADYTGIGTSTISEWKRRGTNPLADRIIHICEFFGITVEWLLTGEGDMYRQRASSGSLTTKESELLESFRQLDDINKGRILERVQTVLSMQEPEPKSSVPARQPKQSMPTPSKPVKTMSIAPETVEESEETEPVYIKTYEISAAAGFGNYLDDDSDRYQILPYKDDEVPPRTDCAIRIAGDSMTPLIHDGDTVFVEERQQIENGQIGIFILNNEALCKELHIDHDRRKISLISLNKKYPPKIVGEHDDLRTVGRVLI